MISRTTRIVIGSILLLVLLALIILALGVHRQDQRAANLDVATRVDDRVDPNEEQLILRGRYLVKAGDCQACHTNEGGKPFAGGRAVPTPFGTIYSTNLTPDTLTGIGRWDGDDFYRAMHFGIDREGKHLYPAFPYPWYTKLSQDDVLSIRAYLATLPPVRLHNRDPDLPWPLGDRAVMGPWNLMFFHAGTYRSDPKRSEEWNCGAYLVNGAGHCGACHSDKNLAGAVGEDNRLRGGFAENAFAPSLAGGVRDGLGDWSVDDIVKFLATGSNDKTSAAGPMAEVVSQSTQYLAKPDLRAIAVYLKDLPGKDGRPHQDSRTALADNDDRMQRGHGLYVDQCAGCHMKGGVGLKDVFPPLKGSASVQAEHADTLVNVVLNGAQKPATPADQTGLAMPAFGAKLGDDDIANLVTYIRNAWGNRASVVSGGDVGGLREKTRKGGS